MNVSNCSNCSNCSNSQDGHDEVVDILYSVANRLAPKFTFGYYDREDVVQEAVIIGLQALSKFDKTRGASLKTFLTIHIYNRLKNFKRNKYCRMGDENSPKKHIVNPISIDDVDDEKEQSMSISNSTLNNVNYNELLHIINTELPIGMRADYLRMLDNVYVVKTRRDIIMNTIKDILDEHDYDIV